MNGNGLLKTLNFMAGFFRRMLQLLRDVVEGFWNDVQIHKCIGAE